MADEAEKYTPQRCHEDDPNRCTARGFRGEIQCGFLAVPGHDKCPMHNSHAVRSADKGIYDLQNTIARTRVEAMMASPAGRNLTTELALARLVLENVFNQYSKNAHDMLINAPAISGAIKEVRETLTAHLKVEKMLSDLIPIERVERLANDMYQAIVEHVKDEETLLAIKKRFEQIIENPDEDIYG